MEEVSINKEIKAQRVVICNWRNMDGDEICLQMFNVMIYSNEKSDPPKKKSPIY
jgi:hypothetical protein